MREGERVMRLVAFILCSLLVWSAHAAELTVVSYNVESDSDTVWNDVADDIQKVTAELGTVDIWGLSEVQSESALNIFRDAAGSHHWYEIGTRGGSDKLAILYDRNRFEAVDGPEELQEIGGSRWPLFQVLKDKSTGQVFGVMVNHFNRGNASKRQRQAREMADWILAVEIPVIAMGDYNIDVDVDSAGNFGPGNVAGQILLGSSKWTWIRPSNPMSTQCNPNYNSILDFVFLGANAQAWSGQSRIMMTSQQYCDDENTGGADHRPIMATIDY